ncbi:MAG: hypothetical protein AAF721_20875 [Myxococcota bacterium]
MDHRHAHPLRLSALLAGLAAFLLSWIGLSGTAQACKCSDGATQMGPPKLSADSSDIRVRHDAIEIVCADAALQQCTATLRQSVENIGGQPIRVQGSAGAWAVGAAVRVGRQHRDALAFWVTDDVTTQQADAIDFSVAAHARVEVIVEAPVAFGRFDCPCYASGLRRRHPVVSRPSTTRADRLTYVVEGGLPRSARAHVTLSVEYPGPARVTSSFADQRRELKTSRVGGARLRTAGTFSDVDVAVFVERERGFVRGGPFVGVGGGWGSDRALRLRAGWELAAPQWVVYALAAESDTTDLRIVPTVQVMSGHGSFPLLPAAAFGLGLPTQVFPRRRVGARAQVDLSWYVVSFVAALDWYPAQGRQPLTGSLFAQLSF